MSVIPGDTLQKDPSAELVYVWDWTDWLVAASINTYVIVMPTSPDSVLTMDNDAIVTGSKKVTMRLKAGTLGKSYKVTCRILTNEATPQTDDRSVIINIRQR